MTIDEIELVLLREMVEKKATCREAAIKIAEWMESEERSPRDNTDYIFKLHETNKAG
jgi:hypothetical protein